MISLAIIAVATVVMINFLIVSVEITVSTLARSFVREEVTDSVILMARDVRNADEVLTVDCDNPTGATCTMEFIMSGQKYRWNKCVDGSAYRVCKDVWNTTTSSYDNVFESSKSVNIDYMDISFGYSESTNNTEANLLFTIAASHARTSLNITNVIKQSSASTRNYQF